MQMYNATVEVARKGFDTDAVMAALAGFHPALSDTPRGWAGTSISLPGESLAQAAAMALVLVERAFSSPAIACEVMTEAELDARAGWVPVPDLVSVSEAAALLKVTRQRVLQMISEGKLPGSKVGREYALPRSAVTSA